MSSSRVVIVLLAAQGSGQRVLPPRAKGAIDRLNQQFPNAVMVHTPRHASWLNQVEIFFAFVQRKVLTPHDFADTDVIAQRPADFESRYSQPATAFKWKFTTTNLDDFLQRLDRHTDQPATACHRRT